VLASAAAIVLSLFNLLAVVFLAWRLTRHAPPAPRSGSRGQAAPVAAGEPEPGPVGPTELGEPPEL
jgi:hypothetical protein